MGDVREQWIMDYLRIHSEPNDKYMHKLSVNTITLDEAFEVLKEKRVSDVGPLAAIFVIVNNPNYVEPIQHSGKLNIKPITKERLSSMNKEWIDKMKNKSMDAAPFILSPEGVVSADRDTDTYNTEHNYRILENIFKKYNNLVYGISV